MSIAGKAVNGFVNSNSSDGVGEGAALLNVRRRAVLPLIVVVHLAVFLLWPAAHRTSAGSIRHNATEIFFVPLTEKNRPDAVSPTAPPAPRRPASQPSSATPKPITAPQSISTVPQPAAPDMPAPAAAIAPVAAPEPQPITAAPTLNAETLLQKARSMAGGVDRELRKESWNPRDKNIIQDQTKLASDIASAFKAQSTTLEEVTMPDGRKMTKIHTPGGTYCGELQSNALTGGRDPFKDGVKTQYHTCPN